MQDSEVAPPPPPLFARDYIRSAQIAAARYGYILRLWGIAQGALSRSTLGQNSMVSPRPRSV